MKFDSADKVEELVWQMRLADLPRGENRAILNRLYNGNPPFDEATAKENNVEINRNTLEGVNLLMQARRQWNNAFLKPGNYFTVSLDSGPGHKRAEWGHIITQEINRRLKRRRGMMEQIRATGANALLHGVGACNWPDRQSPIPVPLPVSSFLTPSETDIDMENCEYLTFFREWTPSQVYRMTHGPKVDPGWNMKLVDAHMKYVATQIQKQPNATAYQYMPERIEELIKQDMGFWGSDAVPTVDVWDFYFRELEDGSGWYRRIILDWGTGETGVGMTVDKPTSFNKVNGESTFLYSSGSRRYAKSLSEIVHMQCADCSAVAPFKIHSIRSLAWMLWGVCDLQNRLHCKFHESVFQSLMWFFRVASNEQLTRLKTVNFAHMGVIPPGVEFIKAQERYTPDIGLVTAAFARNRTLMAENAASFTQDFEKGAGDKEMTATETMARVNSINAMVSGMLALAYTYEEFKYREIARRYCLKNSRDMDVRGFRTACLKRGVPPEQLDVERWDITAERVLGAGNKTLEMAQVQFLQQMRKNLNPDAQRRVDHIAIESSTDDPALAEELASLEEEKQISAGAHAAQLATDRLMSGLPYTPPRGAVYEDYVITWMTDLAMILDKSRSPMATVDADKITGMMNVVRAVSDVLELMRENDDEVEKVKEYENALKEIIKGIQSLAPRAEPQQPQGGEGGDASKVMAERAKQMAALEGKQMMDRVKAANAKASHAQRTAQRQIQFEMEQQREDRRSMAELRREAMKDMQKLEINRLSALEDQSAN